MTKEEYNKARSFRRIVTSELFNRLLEEYDNLYEGQAQDVVKLVLDTFTTDVEALRKYHEENACNYHHTMPEMMAIATENNLWDYSIMDAYNGVKEAMKKYQFLNFFTASENLDEEGQKQLKSLINKVLYIEKCKGNFKDLEISVKVLEEVI